MKQGGDGFIKRSNKSTKSNAVVYISKAFFLVLVFRWTPLRTPGDNTNL